MYACMPSVLIAININLDYNNTEFYHVRSFGEWGFNLENLE